MVCAHILILMCGAPFVFVEYIMKEIRPVIAQILLLQFGSSYVFRPRTVAIISL